MQYNNADCIDCNNHHSFCQVRALESIYTVVILTRLTFLQASAYTWTLWRTTRPSRTERKFSAGSTIFPANLLLKQKRSTLRSTWLRLTGVTDVCHPNPWPHHLWLGWRRLSWIHIVTKTRAVLMSRAKTPSPSSGRWQKLPLQTQNSRCRARTAPQGVGFGPLANQAQLPRLPFWPGRFITHRLFTAITPITETLGKESCAMARSISTPLRQRC